MCSGLNLVSIRAVARSSSFFLTVSGILEGLVGLGGTRIHRFCCLAIVEALDVGVRKDAAHQ
jgi:hypothetical protein